MKCPSFETLQDYFEGLTSDSISEMAHTHLEKCDRCSGVLFEMAMVDQCFLSAASPSPDVALQEAVYLAASPLLEERKRRSREAKRRSDERQELLRSLKDFKDYLVGEGRRPAMQLAGLSAITFVLMQAQRVEKQYIKYSPIDLEVRSFNSEE